MKPSNFATLKRLYNAFDPFRPLPAGDPAYVDCEAVRGDNDVRVELGREILTRSRSTIRSRRLNKTGFKRWMNIIP